MSIEIVPPSMVKLWLEFTVTATPLLRMMDPVEVKRMLEQLGAEQRELQETLRLAHRHQDHLAPFDQDRWPNVVTAQGHSRPHIPHHFGQAGGRDTECGAQACRHLAIAYPPRELATQLAPHALHRTRRKATGKSGPWHHRKCALRPANRKSLQPAKLYPSTVSNHRRKCSRPTHSDCLA